MARLFDDASSQYLNRSGAVVTVEPITMVCWFNSNDATAGQNLICLGDDGSFGYWRLAAHGDIAGDLIRANKRNDAGSGDAVDTTTGYSVNTWHHAAAVFASNTSRSVYIDGGSKGTDTAEVTDPTADFTTIGAVKRATVSTFMSGGIAEAAIYNAALTDAEIAALAYGVSPLRVRPSALVGYWPLPALTGNAIDYSGNGYTLTDTNSVGVAAHAPVGPMFSFDHGLWMPTGAGATGETVESTLQDSMVFAEQTNRDLVLTR